MLGIKTDEGWINWWIGMGVPELDRVQTFQADGDELNLFAQAMELSGRTIRGIAHTKMRGFHIVEEGNENSK